MQWRLQILNKMAKLNLQDVKIALPKDFKSDITESQFIEWLEWVLGARQDIHNSNPLIDVELCDCEVKVGKAILDGKSLK